MQQERSEAPPTVAAVLARQVASAQPAWWWRCSEIDPWMIAVVRIDSKRRVLATVYGLFVDQIVEEMSGAWGPPALMPNEQDAHDASQREACARAYLASILPAESVEQEMQRVRDRVPGHSATAAAILDARAP